MTLEDLLQEELNQRTGRNCAFSAWLTSLSEKDQSTVRAMLANPGISAGFAVEFLQKKRRLPIRVKGRMVEASRIPFGLVHCL